jgi:hypothetical protein
MLKRKIDKCLEEWKASIDKKPLIVRGARHTLHLYSTSTQQKSLPLGGDLGEAYHQKLAHRGDFLFFLRKNLLGSKKKRNFVG